MANAEVYRQITDRMVAVLEKGTVPWRRPWTVAASGLPRSMSTRQAYKGINPLILAMEAQERGYSSPWFGTYNQVAELSGMERRTNPRTGHQYWASPDGTPRGVRKGAHGTQIVLWKTGYKTEPDPDSGEKVMRPVLLARPFTVFNAEQAEQFPDRFYPWRDGAPVAEIREPQDVLDNYLSHGGPALVHRPATGGKLDACYSTGPDRITLPERSQFRDSEAYYATAFHEAAHSTGHKDRHEASGMKVTVLTEADQEP